MRLWDYHMLSILPRRQLLSQLRECVAISKDIYEKGTTNHILINKIMDYDLDHFRLYCHLVICEMQNRGYNVKDETKEKLNKYIGKPNLDYIKYDEDIFIDYDEPQLLFGKWHNQEYIFICLFNLYEKYLCGGIPKYEWDKIEKKYDFVG